MGETATGTVERTVDPGGVIDTDILVDALRRVPTAVTFLRDAERYLTVAAITQMELIQGCRTIWPNFAVLSNSYAALPSAA
jgi:hypothetical protein